MPDHDEDAKIIPIAGDERTGTSGGARPARRARPRPPARSTPHRSAATTPAGGSGASLSAPDGPAGSGPDTVAEASANRGRARVAGASEGTAEAKDVDTAGRSARAAPGER